MTHEVRPTFSDGDAITSLDTIDFQDVLYVLNILDVLSNLQIRESWTWSTSRAGEVPVCSATLFSECAWEACAQCARVLQQCAQCAQCATCTKCVGRQHLLLSLPGRIALPGCNLC